MLRAHVHEQTPTNTHTQHTQPSTCSIMQSTSTTHQVLPTHCDQDTAATIVTRLCGGRGGGVSSPAGVTCHPHCSRSLLPLGVTVPHPLPSPSRRHTQYHQYLGHHLCQSRANQNIGQLPLCHFPIYCVHVHV